jgi:hypothetical protein
LQPFSGGGQVLEWFICFFLVEESSWHRGKSCTSCSTTCCAVQNGWNRLEFTRKHPEIGQAMDGALRKG